MLRVLLTFEPPDGGVAEHVLQLALGLPERGIEVELAGPEDAHLVYEQVPAGTTIHRLPYRRGYGEPATDARTARALAALIRAGDYDLVHAHSAKAGVLARLVAAGRRPPVLYSPHCFPFIGDFGEGRRRFATTVERVLAPATERILCVCEDERRQGIAAGIADRRMRVIHNGSPAAPDDLQPDPALEAFRGDDGILVGSVAVLREQKRVDVLIDAAPAILAADPRVRIAIIGNGPLEADLRARATQLGLKGEPRFDFFPFRAPAFDALAALDVYVLPSSWEAFPIGVLEALACGAPQIATDVGGTREAVATSADDGRAALAAGDGEPEETGLLIPPADPRRLAAAVLELAGDPARRQRMADASRRRHAELFTVDRMVDQVADAYRDAAR